MAPPRGRMPPKPTAPRRADTPKSTVTPTTTRVATTTSTTTAAAAAVPVALALALVTHATLAAVLLLQPLAAQQVIFPLDPLHTLPDDPNDRADICMFIQGMGMAVFGAALLIFAVLAHGSLDDQYSMCRTIAILCLIQTLAVWADTEAFQSIGVWAHATVRCSTVFWVTQCTVCWVATLTVRGPPKLDGACSSATPRDLMSSAVLYFFALTHCVLGLLMFWFGRDEVLVKYDGADGQRELLSTDVVRWGAALTPVWGSLLVYVSVLMFESTKSGRARKAAVAVLMLYTATQAGFQAAARTRGEGKGMDVSGTTALSAGFATMALLALRVTMW